jgi:hypothetical protein
MRLLGDVRRLANLSQISGIELKVSGPTSFTLLEILRATLAEVERSSEVRRDDAAFRELKDSLVRAMAELSLLRNPAAVDPNVPVPAVRQIRPLDS